MDIWKLVLIYTFLLILILGTSSAVDLNNTEVISESNNASFNNLQNLIDQSPENSTINLINDYYSDNDDFPNGIQINKALTINGNNHIINANSNSRIFKVSSPGVVLKNIVFIKGKSDSSGGAVRFDNGGKIYNCVFVNNTANSGGAVYIDNYIGDVTYIKNSSFINNSAGSEGGAIHQFVNCNVFNSTFINNYAPYAGAIYQFNGCSVFGSTFINNSAYFTSEGNSGGYGGAIYQYSCNVYGSTFVNNFASWNGGAIYQQDASKVYDSNFINNSASYGGAIYQVNCSVVYDSNFINNSASHGGAIYQEEASKVYNSNFENNHTKYGCDDIYDPSIHGDDYDIISEINPNYKSYDDKQDKTNLFKTKNNTGNPLILLILSLFVIITKIKK